MEVPDEEGNNPVFVHSLLRKKGFVEDVVEASEVLNAQTVVKLAQDADGLDSTPV